MNAEKKYKRGGFNLLREWERNKYNIKEFKRE